MPRQRTTALRGTSDLDGVLDATLSVGRPANNASAAVTAVGSTRNAVAPLSAAGFFAGTTDEVRIWNVARSLSQIQATKDVQITTPQSNLAGVWNLNEGTGSSLTDSSGNGRTGAAVGNPTWVAGFDPPAPPDAPTLSAPSNGATGVATSPTLDVIVSDPDGGTVNVPSSVGRSRVASSHSSGPSQVSRRAPMPRWHGRIAAPVRPSSGTPPSTTARCHHRSDLDLPHRAQRGSGLRRPRRHRLLRGHHRYRHRQPDRRHRRHHLDHRRQRLSQRHRRRLRQLLRADAVGSRRRQGPHAAGARQP